MALIVLVDKIKYLIERRRNRMVLFQAAGFHEALTDKSV